MVDCKTIDSMAMVRWSKTIEKPLIPMVQTWQNNWQQWFNCKNLQKTICYNVFFSKTINYSITLKKNTIAMVYCRICNKCIKQIDFNWLVHIWFIGFGLRWYFSDGILFGEDGKCMLQPLIVQHCKVVDIVVLEPPTYIVFSRTDLILIRSMLCITGVKNTWEYSNDHKLTITGLIMVQIA